MPDSKDLAQATPEQLERARAAYIAYGERRVTEDGYEVDGEWIEKILSGTIDHYHGIQIALTAILEADQQQAELLRHAEAMAGALKALWPNNLGVVPDHLADDFVFPVDVTAGEFRQAVSAATAFRENFALLLRQMETTDA